MKKSQTPNRRKPSTVNEKCQTKISSFFAKIPKSGISNGNTSTTDVKSLSQTSVEKKRKTRDSISEDELYTNVKKKYIGADDGCNLELANKSQDKSTLSLFVSKKLEDTNSIQRNEILCENIQSKKVDKKNTNVMLTIKGEHNVITVEEVVSDKNINTSKELDNCNKNKLNNLKKEESLALESFRVDGDFNDFFDQEWNVDMQIDFTTLQRCKIINVEYEQKVTILRVQQVKSKAFDTVACSGYWRDIQVNVGDIVTIQAKKEPQWWIIDNNNGYCVIQPDILISSTAVTSSLFCSRRAVLNEKFRKIELLPSCSNDSYTVMCIGSLVHQWLQKVLRENVYTLSDVIKSLDNILQSKDTIDYLYASELPLAECRKFMMEYAPRIFEFIQHYIRGNKQQRLTDLKDNFQESICRIQDIEENVYVPMLGLKGRIDVTTEVKINSRKKIMPLEVKTGKASYSFEHNGQVILYLIMMSLEDRSIDTGLLLYIKENAMREIKGDHRERRDLILLRNKLARYFDIARLKGLQNTILSESDLKMMELPEPINHKSACARCSYQSLCCIYLSRDPNWNLAPSHPLTAFVKDLLNDFESSHLDYIMRWIALIQLEEISENDNNSSSNLWTISPAKREAKGTCIHNLKMVGKVVEQNDKYRCTFARVKKLKIENDLGFEQSKFTENDYIILSTDMKINIATGYITCISKDTVEILLNKDVVQGEGDIRDSTKIFHIDKYLSTGFTFAFNYANVAGLLNNDETIARLRHIIIDKKPATFTEKLPRSVVSIASKIMNENQLNESQQRAVLRVVAAKDYVLIKGMPGTGKTQTLVALIELLFELGSTVLITAHTHSAVDNILLKLLDRNIDFLRLGSTTKQFHPLLTSKTEEYATQFCDTPESLETLYNSKRIVGATCYGTYHPVVRKRMFDICVVDESAQIMQPIVLRPLYSARRFVLVGDPDQLPPVVKNQTAAKLGADESLFIRLENDENTVNLTEQYRMNGRIMKLANDITYRNKLISGNKWVENATLSGSNWLDALLPYEQWIKRTLSKHLDDSVVVLNTGNTGELNRATELCSKKIVTLSSDQIYSNVWEAAIVSRLVQALVDAGVHIRNIGIIAPYNAHVTLLKTIMGDNDVEVNTVDQYQGRDKSIILYSCTRSVQRDTAKKEIEILNDQRRLTVAITRAKHKLIIIADKLSVMRYTPFKRLFDAVDEKNVIDLRDGEDEFNWNNLVSSIL